MTELFEIAENIGGIKEEIVQIKINLREHMARTKASEDRITILEGHVQDSNDHNDKVLEIVVKQAADARKDLNKQLKIIIGVVGAIVSIITALAAIVNYIAH